MCQPAVPTCIELMVGVCTCRRPTRIALGRKVEVAVDSLNCMQSTATEVVCACADLHSYARAALLSYQEMSFFLCFLLFFNAWLASIQCQFAVALRPPTCRSHACTKSMAAHIVWVLVHFHSHLHAVYRTAHCPMKVCMSVIYTAVHDDVCCESNCTVYEHWYINGWQHLQVKV
jgi:hypothetical protein